MNGRMATEITVRDETLELVALSHLVSTVTDFIEAVRIKIMRGSQAVTQPLHI